MILDKLKAYGFQILCGVLGALLATQTLRLHNEQVTHERLKTDVAQKETQRTGAALQYELKVSGQESNHASQTQENSDVFTTSQPVRDAIARADFARVDRLRIGAEARATRYREEAKANAAACINLADQLTALDAHIVRGAGVVARHREALATRDAEVVTLRKQIDIDRALLSDDAQPATPEAP